MKCPHCLDSFFESWTEISLGQDSDAYWTLNKTTCPSCNKLILKLIRQVAAGGRYWKNVGEVFVKPIGMARSPLPKEIPEKYSKAYVQASNVLPISPEASAAISRKCLQTLLRDEVKVTQGDLSREIQEVIDSGKLPTSLAESIDAIRNIGNFASHPIKSTNSGEIVEVESGESEWLLDVLEELFDHYLVKPIIIKAKKDALNQKLNDVGKPPMK